MSGEQKDKSMVRKLDRFSVLSSPPAVSQVNIFTCLHDIEKLTAVNHAQTLATSYGLYTTLIDILGDSAHVIHPDLGSISAIMGSVANGMLA